MVVTHLLALILRGLFAALSVVGLALLTFRRDAGTVSHVLVFAGLACLMASGAIVASDGAQAVVSCVVLLCLAACDALFVARVQASPDLFLAPAFLSGVGVSIAFDTMPGGFAKHAAFVVAGSVACVLALCLTSRRRDAMGSAFPPFLACTVALCALPLVPGLGKSAYGARAWVQVGPIGLQPSEAAKVTLALALAGYFAANARRLRELNGRGFLPIVAVFGLSLLLELAINDLGTGIVLFSLFASLLSLCSRRAGIVYGAALLAGVVALVAVAHAVSPHVAARFAAWRDPYVDPQGIGYQRIRAIEAMSNGGILGTGLHFGLHLADVPAVSSDYAFAAVVEELGLAGGLATALAVVAVAAGAARTASRLREGSFERNVVTGGGCLLACQSLIIIGGVTGVIPLTGVTLPFVSSGGTSMVCSLCVVGLMGGCAASADSRRADGRSASLAALPAAAAVGVALCLAAVAGTGGGPALVGSTRREATFGRVLTGDGVVLAKDGAEGRSYPERALAAHLLGAASGGVEASVCSEGTFGDDPVGNALALPRVADDTVLTIDSVVQREAERQLEGVTGAIVALDAGTGAVVAMASSPAYDASAGYDPGAGDGVSYLNRATGALYAPGSTFKVVTMAAALEAGAASPESLYSGDTLRLASGDVVTNFGGADYGDMALTDALAASSNTAFAQLALGMGDEAIAGMAERLGFDGTPCVTGVDASSPVYVCPKTDYARAWASVGQPVWVDDVEYGPRATVLGMCSVMATVANDGVRREPYLIQSGPLATGRGEGVAAMSVPTADALWGMLVESAGASLSGIEVAGKTGTAQWGDGTLCWYVCAADGVAVACCVEADAGGLGATDALPRAMAVLGAAVAS